MTQLVSKHCTGGDRPRISLEIEKLGRNYSPILPYVDLVFVSKEYVISKGINFADGLCKFYQPFSSYEWSDLCFTNSLGLFTRVSFTQWFPTGVPRGGSRGAANYHISTNYSLLKGPLNAQIIQ